MSARRERRAPAGGARRARAPGRERGLSLVELMIALVLGLIVTAAAFNVYAATVNSQRFTAGLVTMQESGRFGLSTLQRGLRLAGFSERPGFEPFDWDEGGRTAADAERIVVRIEAARDCNGADTAAHGGVAENAYVHDRAARTVTCAGNDGTPGVLLENVEELRILYGVDTDADGLPERFLAHADVAEPTEVVALRVGLLVRSGDLDVRTRSVSRTYAVLDTTTPAFDDRILREVFATTVKLRNR